ncbi:response regulator receiver protein [Alkalicaulis satelles]|uniref:Response regulator receiver protein n=1 Tax=Alkalicaulis satelles TaxID=2609175 RepID=A0A5M6ZLM3_9PROT|nr:response regulator receiver protein [Alkalicaulis satelles]KAA5804835.1 response regulator receiver protein [Alkalicaulis satelles]
MAELDYRRASVALFDPVHVNLRTTRYALHEIGFRDIVSLNVMAELKRRLQDEAPNLLVIETADHEAEVFRLVRAIRAGEVTNNPFSAILLTTWRRDTGLVREAIGSGADDVIIRPFSTSFAEERIRTLVKARKPFIVTSDYIGPDRRRDSARGPGAAPSIVAPNVLQAVVENDEDALMRARAWIDEARRTVDGERLRRLCMRVIIGAEAASGELRAGREPVMDVNDFERGAREVRARLSRTRSAEAKRVAQALCEVSAELREPGGFTLANLSLARELAMAAYVAYAGDDGMERSRAEIENAVGLLQQRMASAAARKAQPDSGVVEEAELKRAAS